MARRRDSFGEQRDAATGNGILRLRLQFCEGMVLDSEDAMAMEK